MYNKKRISATQLESFLSCPMRFKFMMDGAEQCNSYSALQMGTLFHIAIQSPSLALIKLEKQKEWWTALERSHMKELIRHAGRFKLADAYEDKVEAEVDGIELSWHIDEIHIDEDIFTGDVAIRLLDNKTTKSKWTMDDYSKMKQRYMYSYLMYRQTGCNNITFDYRVLPKKKVITDDDIRVFSEKINLDEAEAKIKWWIKEYKKAVDNNYYPAEKWTHCFFCPYREICQEWYKRKKKVEVDFSLPWEQKF